MTQSTFKFMTAYFLKQTTEHALKQKKVVDYMESVIAARLLGDAQDSHWSTTVPLSNLAGNLDEISIMECKHIIVKDLLDAGYDVDDTVDGILIISWKDLEE